MKAIILAAGRGRRMGEYGENLPKSLLPFAGSTLLDLQMTALRRGGVTGITIVTGFKHELIAPKGCTLYRNPEYATTNMVESLMCARPELEGEVLLAYADIVYSVSLVEAMLASTADVAVAVDDAWRDYWKARYGTTETDLESLTVSPQGKILELGRSVESSEGIDYRYIGLVKCGGEGLRRALALYDIKQAEGSAWVQSGQPFRQGYMTDLLSELINAGVNVEPVVAQHGWLEFDTEEDYELACELERTGEVEKFVALPSDDRGGDDHP
jgi:choline kinase